MQRPVRVSEAQLLALFDKARNDYAMAGFLSKRSADSAKWKLRWFTLYQNILFYNDSDSGKLLGIIFLEGCYCEPLVSGSCAGKQREPCDRQHCFVIKFRREDLRHYVFQAETDSSCYTWIEAIEQASFNKVLLMKEELEQKHLHLLQIVESEKTARCQYTLQCEELSFEVKKLRSELCALKKEGRPLPGKNINQEKESDEIRKIKKVQSFFRGWLCRRRWKQIVEEYIRSPHAENMRKRNSLVFRMVEEEERYVEQLHLLISCYLRPFKMAASSKTPPCSHDDVNSIFLNSETVLFLHQIFLKGLTARMESWPTLVLGMHKIGDLFDMLLPMLSIYQEYVRNHHYSLQVLAECKQSPAFVALLKRLEEKPNCQNRSLETFLTYPMHQIPRYITTLHELLAHTPHNHVERKSLENARTKLEELSRQMHDEVSETENIRKNLSIERMIVEGCDILLDVNQVFVRQGTLIQLPTEKPKGPRNRIGSFKSSDKEVTRQCFLFTNHLILTTRTSSGRLHLVQGIGKIPLADATLIEDPSEHSIIEDDGESSVCSGSSHSSGGTENQPVISKNDYQSLDFKLIIDVKSGPSVIIHLLAAKLQEKNAWISDISHCMDNVHFNDLFHGSTSNTSSVTMPQSIRNDPRLFKDDIDIRFSRTLNSCKVPQIRYATPERLLERLTDLRFLSIDFLNTFLLTYRVFTNGVTVLEALKHVYYNPEVNDAAPTSGISESQPGESVLSPEYDNMRRISTSSVVSSVEPGEVERERSLSHDSRNGIQVQHWRWSHRKFEEEQQHREMNENATNTKNLIFSNEIPDTSLNNKASTQPTVQTDISISDSNLLNVPSTLAASTSLDTLTETAASSPSTPQALSTSTNTLVAEAPEESVTEEVQEEIVITKNEVTVQSKQLITMSSVESTSSVEEEYPLSPPPDCTAANSQCLPPSHSSQNIQISYYSSRRTAIKRGSADTSTESSITSPRSSFQLSESPQHSSRAGVVITSHRASQRRSSTSSAAAAFAVATAGSSNPRDLQCQTPRGSIGHRYSTVSTDSRLSYRERLSICKRESIISTAATMRVLNVLRHWVSKHSQDFESNSQLKSLTIEFLEELLSTASLLPVEQKAASQLLRMITRENSTSEHVDLDMLLATPTTPSKESIETLQALDIAEQMTYLDHKIFISIRSEEFLGQAWNKPDKAIRAPNIHLMSQRFNDMSRLVASEIIRHSNLSSRIAVIEKWTAVADICRCFHNFNGVFQIASAFECSAIFRLKKTWEKIPKTHRQTIEKIKNLASYDGRFRNLRESLHRCDPPCIPFLGMYLSDLSFIEEGTPNFTEDNLLNFSKMRMIAHVIRDVRRFQQTPYKIEWNQKVANYLLDPSLLLSDEELYNTSLAFEPRTSRLGSISHS